MKIKMNNKGVTLIELMVYMVLAVLLLAPVVLLMRNSSVNMARDAVSTELQMSGRDILNMMYEDIRNLGFKLDPTTLDVQPAGYYFNVTRTWTVPGTTPPVTHTQRDSSSFMSFDHGTSSLHDSLTFRKGQLSGAGDFSVDTIRYSIRNSQLMRTRLNDGSSQVLARNVVALQFEYAVELTDTANPSVPLRGPWFDIVPTPISATVSSSDLHLEDKRDVKYIRVSVVLRDSKNLAAVRKQPFTVANVTITPQGEALYELHQIVIPVPNNGLFPPGT